MAKILIVEDDEDLCERLCDWLSFEQHTVEVLINGNDAEERLRFFIYDLIVLDWDLPGLTGLEICRNFRTRGGTTPIIMLTGKTTLVEKETGLDSGADDYLTKPFHLKELSARIRALLRRPPQISSTILKMKDLEVDLTSRRVNKNGQELNLLPKEFALLEFFLRHPNEVFSPDALLERIWHSASDSSIESVYTYIKTLRKKISPESPTSYIKTVHGIGYRLTPD